MRGSRSFFLMVTVVGFACHIGNAFVYYGTPSLELEVIRAQVILRGRVTRVNLGGFADGYESIGFRISEVLKGNYTTQSEITVSNPFWSTKKNEWKKGDSDAIVFLAEERGIPRVHYLLSRVLMTLIAIHVTAALYHALLLRDGLLGRMWFGRRRTTATASNANTPSVQS